MEIKKNKITAILGLDIDLNIDEEKLELDFLKNIKVIDYLQEKLKNVNIKKIEEALKICLLTDNDKVKPLNVLSSNEVEKLELAIKLLENREMIILSDFEINFLNREFNYFKNLFKKMVTKYNKTVVFITNNLTKIMDIIDFILVVENRTVVLELNAKNIYYDKIYDYVDMPEIIKFVKLAKKNHAKLEDYTDINELIKGIFRSV